jgi:hypothetical protein
VSNYFIHNLMTQEAEASIALDRGDIQTRCLEPEDEEEYLMREYANGVVPDVVEIGTLEQYTDWRKEMIEMNRRLSEEVLEWEERDGYWVQADSDLYVVWPESDDIFDDNFSVWNPAMCDEDALSLIQFVGNPITVTFTGDANGGNFVAQAAGHTVSSCLFCDAVCRLILQVHDAEKA